MIDAELLIAIGKPALVVLVLVFGVLGYRLIDKGFNSKGFEFKVPPKR